MLLIVGLGNPGKKYEKTRHNVGFRVVDVLAKDKPNDAVLLKPQTLMNNSGDVVVEAVNFYKIKPIDLWIVHDDIDLPLGEFKIQMGKSSAGHKGVESIIKRLGTKDFNRIRIGICPPKGKPEAVEKFVLEKFTKAEETILKKIIQDVAEKVKSRG